MQLYFLGTGAGMPSLQRNVSAVALNLLAECGAYWLFDCGEGTQQQIQKAPVKLSKMNKLFITHLHGDHLYGLPGLLTSRSYLGGETPLILYGPKGIREFIYCCLRISQAHLSYDLQVVEIEEGTVFSDGSFTVEAGRVDHRIESFGFRITEADLPGSLQIEKLKGLGVPAGPVYGELKKGKTVTLSNGLVLHGQDFVGPSIPGKKIAVIGDTRLCNKAIELAQSVDVLVHEATFSSMQSDMAERYFHTTARDAGRIALEANAGALILTHISSRYQEDAASLLLEAQSVFPNTYLAKDLWDFPIK